jgi:SAM-dependent methyltransferase
MSQFAEKDFDTNNYNSKRPGYPPSLFKALFAYHQGPTALALEVGCGPGTASFPLLQYVDKLVATDPSEVMVHTAIESIPANQRDRIEFKVAPAESLHELIPNDGCVDLITSAEALHWFDHPKFFEEAARVIRPGGTLAYWGYVEPRFIDFPKANEIYEKYVFEDERFMGPCWVQPGKNFLRYFFKDVYVPEDYFTDVEKWDYYPGESQKHTAYFLGDHQYTMKKFRDYLSSWSALHTWRKQNSGKDVIDFMVDEMKEACGWEDDTELRVEWGTSYVFARRR